MPIYVARWEEVTEPNGNTSWVPLGVGDASFAAIDLTPPGAAPWRCIFRSPVVLADVPGRRRLSEPGERLTTLIRNRLGNDLGITLEDRPSLAEILAHILLDHAREDGTRWRPLKPERDGALRINLGGRVWEMLPIRGGASITDNFNRADSTDISTGAPFPWTEINGDWTIDTNALQAPNAQARARAESDLASDDHYAEVGFATLPTNDRVGAAVRYSSAADTCYYFATRNNASGTRQLVKCVAGVLSVLATTTTSPSSGAVTVRCEANGSALRGLENTIEKITATDTAITGNVRTGVAMGQAATVKYDDFAAADLGAGDQTVTPGLITNTPVLYSPRIDQQVQIGLIGSSTDIFAPSVEIEPQTVSPGLIENAPVLFAPTVNQNVVIGIILNSSSVHAPEVGQSVDVGLIANSSTVHAPRIDQSVLVGVISNAPQVHAPTITDDGPQTVSVGLISHGTHVYSPALTKFWVRETGSPRNRRPGTTRIHKRSRGRDPGIDTGN